ncbi:MAG: tetratricopeptide repeat protein [Acidobacteria bacterium]|nr:tetratricopeptide repeat protein [Acidobacteriota bacterium]
MECTDSEVGRLITRYELGAVEESEREAFVEHLIQCEYCHNEIYSMAPFMRVLREHREKVSSSQGLGKQVARRVIHEPGALPPFWRRWPVLAAASLLVTLGAGLLAVYLVTHRSVAPGEDQAKPTTPAPAELSKGSSPPWINLEIPKAAYTPPAPPPVLRGGDFQAAFERAMVAYQQNDFAAAAKQLDVVIRLEPEHAEAHFYRGVSLLLVGRSQEAISNLQQAVRLSTGAQRETSRYYLALAYLKANRLPQALAELEAVSKMGGPHRESAEKLRHTIVNK